MKRLFLLGLLVGFLWPLYRLIFSEGWILDDELSHFMFSRAALHWPEVLLDEWARPGRNLIHSLVAPFGLSVTRIYTLLLSTCSVWVAFLVAKKLGIRHAWCVSFLLCFQPWYPELSYAVLTQAPFMLVWIVGGYLAYRNKFEWAALMFGYLSLIRHEGIVITALWGGWFIARHGGSLNLLLRRYSGDQVWRALKYNLWIGCLTVLPIFLFNIIAFQIIGEWPFGVYFESRPTEIYGSGSLFHYVPLLLESVGKVTLSLATIGMCLVFKRGMHGWGLILLTNFGYFIMHTLIFWKGAFASGGYVEFLMPMAPFFALCAAVSIDRLLSIRKVYAVPLVGGLITYIIFQGVHLASYQHKHQDWENILAGKAEYRKYVIAPVRRASPLAKQIEQAVNLVKDRRAHSGVRVHCADVYFYYFMDLPDTSSFRSERLAPLSEFPVGSFYIWEKKYADLENRTSYDTFARNSNWKMAFTWFDEQGKRSVVVFEKINNKPTQEVRSPKGKNLSY